MHSSHKVVQMRLTYVTHMRGITHCLTEWALKIIFISSVPILLYHSWLLGGQSLFLDWSWSIMKREARANCAIWAKVYNTTHIYVRNYMEWSIYFCLRNENSEREQTRRGKNLEIHGFLVFHKMLLWEKNTISRSFYICFLLYLYC